VSAVRDAALECLRTGGVWGQAEPLPGNLVATVPLRQSPLGGQQGAPMQQGGPPPRLATPPPMQQLPMQQPPMQQPPMYQQGPPPSMAQGAQGPYASMPMQMQGAPASTQAALQAARGSRTWIWFAIGVIAVGAAVGAILAFAT
jgi:hypothetical protein